MVTFSDIVKYIDSLPPLSDVVVDIQNLYIGGVDSIDIERLIELIESDPLLTANILKFVNSPAFGIRRRVHTAAQAVTLLGVKMVYGVVMDYAINEKLIADVSAYGIKNSSLKEISILQSRLTMKWLGKVSGEYAKFLSPLALLMETGKLVVASQVKSSDYVENFQRQIESFKNISRYEYELLGTTSYFVSGMLFEHWNFDPLYVKLLKNLDFKYSKMSDKMKFAKNALKVVRTAVNVKERLSDESIQKAASLVKKMKLDEKVFLKEVMKIKEEL